MKRHYLLQSFVLAILITNTLYASTYEYSFCYGNSASQSTYGDGTWGSILEIIVWINTNNTVTAKIQKKDGSSFSSSGNMYLQGMSPDEDPGYNLASAWLYSGNSSITLVASLNNNLWRNNKLNLYGRFESSNGGYAWAGSVSICREIPCTQIKFYADTDNDGYGDPSNPKMACTCPSGYVYDHSDCNDNDGTVHSKKMFYIDSDKDGLGGSNTMNLCKKYPVSGFSDRTGDCDDLNGSIQSKKRYYVDSDRDGTGGSRSDYFCQSSAPSGYSTRTGDCDDNDGTVESKQSFYIDSDIDGIGSSRTEWVCASSPPYGYANRSGDCDDNYHSVQSTKTYYIDNDWDGTGGSETASVCASSPPIGKSNITGDCNDNDDSVISEKSFYVDADEDGFGSSQIQKVCASRPPKGYANNSSDCNDNDDQVHTEKTFFIDSDYDGFGSTLTKRICASSPLPGYADNSLDCNDQNDQVHSTRTFYIDADQDGFGSTQSQDLCAASPPEGFSTNANDCNDNDLNIHPQAAEICNQIDDNCNGEKDEGIRFMILASMDTGGLISPSGEIFVNCGAQKTFHISANEGYEIADLNINDVSAGPLTTYSFENITKDHQSIQASFKLKQLTITILMQGNGNGNLSEQTQILSYGANLTVKATPDDNSKFIGWSGDASGSTDAILENITSNKTIIATFEPKDIPTVLLQFNKQGNGDIRINNHDVMLPFSQEFELNETITVSAQALDGWQFSFWSGSITDSEQSIEIQMNNDKTITANFVEIPPEILSLYISDIIGPGHIYVNETVCEASPCSYSFISGSDIQVLAEPSHLFESFTGDIFSNKSPFSFILNENTAIKATFENNITCPQWDFVIDSAMIINYSDLGAFADHWLLTDDEPNWNPDFNLSLIPDPDTRKQIINYRDLSIFADHWLEPSPCFE
jgi:hypothetical protein